MGLTGGGGGESVRKGKKHQERLFTGCSSCLWRRRSWKSSALLLRSCSCILTASRIPSIRLTSWRFTVAQLSFTTGWCQSGIGTRQSPTASVEWVKDQQLLYSQKISFCFSDNHHVLLRPTIPSRVDDDIGAKYSHCALWKGKKHFFSLMQPKRSQMNYYTFKRDHSHLISNTGG